jgi:hypothetical protein
MPLQKASFLTLFTLFFALLVNAQTVYITPSGAKYHLATCRMVKNVSKEIETSQASELGLSPCKICRPQNISPATTPLANKAKGQSSSVQCGGLTKAGARCRHMTRIANGFCFQHQN